MAAWRAVIDLPSSLHAPATARRVVADVLRGWGLEALVADAEQVVTEIVTNALAHAPGADSYELELVHRPDGVRIYLADGSAVRPVVRELDAQSRRGRGMRVVAALTNGWGCDEHHGGKRVWVDLDVGDAAPMPHSPER